MGSLIPVLAPQSSAQVQNNISDARPALRAFSHLSALVLLLCFFFMLHINMYCVKAAHSFEWATNASEQTKTHTCALFSNTAHHRKLLYHTIWSHVVNTHMTATQ